MVLTAGSTGDVEPFAALAAHLAERGHDVTLTADAAFAQLGATNEVEFAPIHADFRALMPKSEGGRPSLRDDVFPVIRGMLEDSWAVAKMTRPQMIVAHDKTLAAPHLAEKLGIPHVRALTIPMLTPTREFPLPGMVRHDLGGLLNRASYRLTGLLKRPYSGLIRRWREGDLTLRARGKPPAPARTLYCYSPSFVPTPRDWPPDTIATGYWLREDAGDESLDPALKDFVASGEPPVYVGFGSSVGPDPGRLSTVVSEALRKAGARGVIATGWGGIADLPAGADRMVIADAPHRWLFPRVAAVVHHGGGHDGRGIAGRSAHRRLSISRRPTLLGCGGASCGCRPRAPAGEEADRRQARRCDPHGDRGPRYARSRVRAFGADRWGGWSGASGGANRGIPPRLGACREFSVPVCCFPCKAPQPSLRVRAVPSS